MKTRLCHIYDDYDRVTDGAHLFVTPESRLVVIDIDGVPYENVYAIDKKDWPDRELISTKLYIDTSNVDRITLEIYETV